MYLCSLKVRIRVFHMLKPCALLVDKSMLSSIELTKISQVAVLGDRWINIEDTVQVYAAFPAQRVGTSPGSPSNAVDVVVNIPRHVVVEDMGHSCITTEVSTRCLLYEQTLNTCESPGIQCLMLVRGGVNFRIQSLEPSNLRCLILSQRHPSQRAQAIHRIGTVLIPFSK